MSSRTPLLVLAFLFAAAAAIAEPVYLVMPHSGVTVYDTDDAKGPLPPPDKVLKAGNITFNITYLDTTAGFNHPTLGAARRANFEQVLQSVNDILNETGTIDVQAQVSETDGNGFLASAGTFFSSAVGFQSGSTLQRIRTGVKPFPAFPEISVVVDFGFTYFLGAGNAPAGQIDFKSVMLHEITHGLGFVSLAGSNGASTLAPNVYSNLDALIARRTGQVNLFAGTPPAFVGISADLISNNLAFKGNNANTRYAQGVLPGIFAPGPFQPGSSLSHWDTGNIVGGAVMEHLILSGTTRRNYAPVDLGALIDIGWTAAAFPGEGEGEPEPEFCALDSVDIINPVSNIILGPGIPSTVVQFRANVVRSGSAGCLPGTVEVTYTLPANVGTSTNAAANFPVNVSLGPGNYTLVATARLVETGVTRTDTQNFAIVATPLPPAIAVTPNPPGGVNFGNVDEGAAVEVVFTVTNTGGGTLTGTASTTGAAFSVTSGANYALAGGASQQVRVRFAPTGDGNFTGSLTFTGTGLPDLVIPIRGTGIKTSNFGCGPAPSGGKDAIGDVLVALALAVLLLIGQRRTLHKLATRRS